MTRLLNLLAVGTLWFCLATPSLAAQAKVTWYGHAAFKVVTPGGKVMLVDPWISNPSNPTAKKDLENLRKVDLIFLTHGHADHIGDTAAIARQTGAKLVASFDLQKAMVAYKGFPEKQAELATTGSFGGQITLLDGEVTVLFVPAIHGASMDTPGGPVYAGHPGGFLISVKNGPRIYHTGDTDLFNDMALLKGQVDLMLLCIGDKFTMGPVRAAQAVNLVRPKLAVPMHFGTFPALTGTPEQFARELQKFGLRKLLRQMQVGETLVWR
ncbi:MAG: metal-dependent hydrolase [Trichlorobacter sp.]|jgi:L-ascorbate metabolism protein UlaG (beta-lactamase superfamily)